MSGTGAATGDNPTRGRISAADGSGPELHFHFNPSMLTAARNTRWRSHSTANARGASTPQYTGADPMKWTLELLFDAFEGDRQGVVGAVRQLVTWTEPTPQSEANEVPRPPLVKISWGSQTYGPGYLKTVSAKYLMFGSDGVPLRAKVKVIVAEVPQTPRPTNPTSGGPAGRRSSVVHAGDTLASVSFREYGRPDLWRALAELNGIDDPARVPPGTSLLVPPRSEAQRLTGRVRD